MRSDTRHPIYDQAMARRRIGEPHDDRGKKQQRASEYHQETEQGIEPAAAAVSLGNRNLFLRHQKACPSET
jgi:hypothetical protein